ncbi:MAG: ribonuclease Z, partial [Cyclobacteriaceae bacterium]|nr:ribonuclease Z [Cyclobacteriaceae bacterium]
LLAQLRHAKSSLHFKIVLHPLTEGEVVRLYENEFVSVDSFPLDHKIPTCGFLFREKTPLRSLDKTKPLGEVPLPYLSLLKQGEDVTDERTGKVYRSAEYTLPPRAPRSYAYCSDTQPSDRVVQAIAGADLVYHEATFLEEDKSKARETLHSTAAEAAQVAKQAGAKKLLLGHFSARYKDLNKILAEAVSIFPNTALAAEGETIEIAD